MSRIRNQIIKSLLSGCLLTTPIFLSLISCSKEEEEKITKITLFLPRNNVRPGETLSVKAIVDPGHIRTNDLNWSLSNAPDGVTISNMGIISVPEDLQIDSIRNITITAGVKDGRDVFGEIDAAILPKPNLDFQGFVNDEIQYLGRDHKVTSMKINQITDFIYETEGYIDLFVGDDRTEAPPYFTSWFYFQPIVSSVTKNYMAFNMDGGSFEKHGIQWDGGYIDGVWVEQIPDFLTIDPSCPLDLITVNFSCDPRVVLKIHLNIWLNQSQITAANMWYIPDDTEHIHNLEMLFEGNYQTNLFCPSQWTTGEKYYTNHIGKLYVSRAAREYTEFIIDDFEEQIEEQSIADALTVEVTNRDMYIRPYDHMRIYEFDVNYTFDLEKMQWASFYEYKSFFLGSINIRDPFFPSSKPGWLDMYIEWI